MAQFVGDSNGKARQIYNMYVGDANGKARKIKKAYVGDANGKARLFYENAVRQNSSDIYGMYIFGGQCTDEVGEATYCYPLGYDNSSTELTAGVVYRFMLDPRDYYSKPEQFNYYAPNGSGGMDWVYKEAVDTGSQIIYEGALPFGTTMCGFAYGGGHITYDTVDVGITCYEAITGVYPVETDDYGDPLFDTDFYGNLFPQYWDTDPVYRDEKQEGNYTVTLQVGKWYALVTDYGMGVGGMDYMNREYQEYEGFYCLEDDEHNWVTGWGWAQTAIVFKATADLTDICLYNK